MLLERAEILVKDGLEEGFAATMKGKGLPLLASLPGVLSASVGRGVENPDKFMLLVMWEALEDHTAFTKMPIFATFREMLMPFSKGGSMEHFNMFEAN
jgi:heme-degrading monooxygenase HmoA